MKSLKYLPLLLFICLTGLSIYSINHFYKAYQDEQKLNKEVYLNQTLDKSVETLERELDKISILVAGLKSHLLQSQTELQPEQVRNFIAGQYSFLDYSENIIINFIDANHRFIYTVATDSIFVNDLAGTSVLELRSNKVIDKLNALLKTDEIVAFSPLNLYEGHVGLPVDFRYKIKEEVKGYFAVIVDVKNLITPIIDTDVDNEFTYRFTASDEEIEFDREKVYDGTKVYSNKIDAKNKHKDKTEYKYKSANILGLPITVGIAFNDSNLIGSFGNFIQSILGVFMLLLIGTGLLLYLFYQNIRKTNEQKLVNAELNKSNSLLKKFIFASSHDLKQPLVNISNFQNLLEQSPEADKSKNYLKVIRDNIDHMTNLLDDLMIYSRIYKEDKRKEQVNVNDILENIKNSFQNDKVKINFETLEFCYGIKSEITRLFQNLINNSIKYNENENIKIDISSKEFGKQIAYSVSDNGIGIKEEHEVIVFTEFQRVHGQKYAGTGLGLSICKEIVENHGGSIKAKANPKEGTKISFTISKYVK